MPDITQHNNDITTINPCNYFDCERFKVIRLKVDAINTRVIIGKINEIYILITEKSIREILRFFQNIPDQNRTGISGIKPWTRLGLLRKEKFFSCSCMYKQVTIIPTAPPIILHDKKILLM